ncbi:MAG: hypothetical protein ABI042_01715 [Verrucomicrobiota bacterium]
MKQSLELNKVVLLGRTFEEYLRYFGLKEEQLKGKKILDMAGGVSSFCAEANAKGFDAKSFDPIYELSPEEIRLRCEPDLEFVSSEISKVAAYKWNFYKTPAGMRKFRERAYRLFLADFREQKENRYICGRLPRSPFRDGQFDLTLVSYFLFVYEEQFDYEFHRQSLQEILRITSHETRIYPLVNFKAERSGFVERIKNDSAFEDFSFEEVQTNFEFLRNSNSYLRIRRRS